MFGLKARQLNTHKGNYGKILIVSGKTGMAGAAVLCAKGALRSGAGLVQISVKPEILNIVQTGVPEATCVTRDEILENLYKYDSVVFGPGIGVEEEESILLKEILKNYEGKIIIDADGINILAAKDNIKWLRESKASVILTPHMGEAIRLGGNDSGKLSREELAISLFNKSGSIIILKGHNTIVYGKDGIWINNTGNPGMATAGSGDVLAGIIAGFCGQGLEINDAAKLGVYIHGKAGDIAKETLGEHGIIGSDLCYYTAIAIKSVLDE